VIDPQGAALNYAPALLRACFRHVRYRAYMAQTFGRWIRDSRVALRKSLRDVAGKLDIAPSYLSDIEHDRRVPSEEVLRGLAKELSLDFEEAITRAGRVGDEAEQYLRQIPEARVLLRRASEAKLSAEDLKKLIARVGDLSKRNKPAG
jgi:transcriptional regulator with XRE-family HTH domain